MRIRRIRGISGQQLFVASAVGVLGGLYIWRPVFDQLHKNQNLPKPKEENVDNSEATK